MLLFPELPLLISFSIYVNCAFISCTGKICFQVIAERLSEEEIGGLKELFNMIDTDNSGTITFEELKEGLKRVGSELMESEIKSLMDAVSRSS